MASSTPKGSDHQNFLLSYLHNQEQNLLTQASQEIEYKKPKLTISESIKNIQEFNNGNRDKAVIANSIIGYFIINNSNINQDTKKELLSPIGIIINSWLSQRQVIPLTYLQKNSQSPNSAHLLSEK